MKKGLLFWATLLSAFTAIAQTNFTYLPKNPKAGDLITITYKPSGELAATLDKVEAQVFVSSTKGRNADDLVLNKSGNKYTATLQTDTSNNFIQFGFYVGDKFDSNFNEGYFIQLYGNDKLKRGGNLSLVAFHQFYCQFTGVKTNLEKALLAYENEMVLFPETQNDFYGKYLQMLLAAKKDNADTLIRKEIERIKQRENNNEKDWADLLWLYRISGKQQEMNGLKSELIQKYPEGDVAIREFLSDYYQEKSIEKKKEKFSQIEQNIINKTSWSSEKKRLDDIRSSLLTLYIELGYWSQLDKEITLIENKEELSSLSNNAAWKIQETNQNLDLAAKFSKYAVDYSQEEWINPKTSKPDYLTTKQWIEQRKNTYAMYADTYAMVLFRLGQHQNAYKYAKEATFDINEGISPDYNNTYALIAKEVLPKSQLKSELEEFVKVGAYTSNIKDILKRVYTEENKSSTGFDEYMANLQKENQAKIIEELRKSMVSEDAPIFTLKDLDGNLVNSADLKGKVLVLDFWATWCGPCLASFPSMQQMVKKYENDSDVKFLFVDTWERGDAKEQKAAEFIASNKYSFHVLMDNDNKVVEQFKVSGIPTKFVIDKEGKVRFKSSGFGGSDDALITELSLMIEMAQNSNPN